MVGPVSVALPPGWCPPRYGRQTLAELLPSLAAVLGVPGYDDVLGLSGSLPDVRRIVVVLIDGLGRANLARHADAAPTLAGLADPCGGLDAVAPTTTPTNLTSLSTGRPPGEHGVVGFTVAVPGSGQLLTHISWGAEPIRGAGNRCPASLQWSDRRLPARSSARRRSWAAA